LGGESLIGKVFAHILNCCYPSTFSGLETPQKRLFYLMGKFRLTTIREHRVLTPVGWAALSIAFGFVLVLIILFVHPFLAPTKPVGGGILVVEGWLPDYALEKVKERFQQGSYQLLVTTGAKIGVGYRLSEYKTWAELAASTLKNLDFPEDKIMTAPVHKNIKRGRTYHSILAVQRRLHKEGLNEASIDVVSLGVHARRTWILFEKVFSSVNVGVVAISPNEYDVSRWWLSSEGVRNVISESVAYLYARFIFSPPIK
jgi:hypothetical protein